MLCQYFRMNNLGSLLFLGICQHPQHLHQPQGQKGPHTGSERSHFFLCAVPTLPVPHFILLVHGLPVLRHVNS